MEFAHFVSFFSGFTNPALIYALLPGILILCGFGLPVPEDITLLAGGYLAYLGYIDIRILLPLLFIAVIGGDCIIFTIGSRLGFAFLRHRLLARFLTPEHLRKASAFIDRYHTKIFFIARFLPGLRATIFFTGGALGTRFWKFFVFDLLAALISVPLLVLGSYFGGSYIDAVLRLAKGMQLILIAGSVIVSILIVRKLVRYYRSRRTEIPASEPEQL